MKDTVRRACIRAAVGAHRHQHGRGGGGSGTFSLSRASLMGRVVRGMDVTVLGVSSAIMCVNGCVRVQLDRFDAATRRDGGGFCWDAVGG